jgi:hypothetical protein
MLTDQWFVAMNQVSPQDPTGKSIAQKAIDAVQSGEVSFVPENWINTYNQWMNNIHRLVHQPPTLVGPSNSRLVRRRRQGLCGAR